MPFNVGSVLDGAAALLNDANKTSFTNVAMFPYLQIAYQELRQELEENNVSVVNRTSDAITILAGVTEISFESTPSLPQDLIDPQTVYERTNPTNDNFLQMRRYQTLPLVQVATPFLMYWSWQNQVMKFPAATSDIDIKIDYVGDPLITITDDDETVRIKVFNTQNFLKYRTAALCSNFQGENSERATLLDNMGARSLESCVNIAVKSMQSISTRRRPFRASAKSNGWGTNGW